MPDALIYIRIKKQYAAAIIEDLQLMGALEVVSDENMDIPKWQIELGEKEIESIAAGNTQLIDWNEAKKQFEV